MNRRLRVLYVDDEEDIRTIVELALGNDPEIDVVTAASGKEALARIGSDGWMPDLAIVDLMMPEMPGVELLAALRAREDTAALPVLFITASARSADMARYNSLGAIGVISKPFDVISLPGLVRKHFEDSRGRSATNRAGDDPRP